MQRVRGWSVLVVFVLLLLGSMELDAWARAGGGRSFGGGSSRSFSTPYRSYTTPGQRNGLGTPQAPQSGTLGAPAQQPWGSSGFFRSLAGGIAGGFLGSLLFSSLGFAGLGGLGGFGGGIGLLEILLFAGIAYAVVAYLRRWNEQRLVGAHAGPSWMSSAGHDGYRGPAQAVGMNTALEDRPEVQDLRRGLTEVGTVVLVFDAGRFPEEAMDVFFRIQAAWAGGDLDPARGFLAPEIRQELQRDLDTLKGRGKINRLENIAVRRSEIRDAWVEAGNAFITVHFLANLLDYTIEEQTGRLLSGSRETPVKFEECWTFIRPAGGSSWQLTAIQQIE